MAIMHPKNAFDFNSNSERILYNELKKQLPDSYEVFYSVVWYDSDNGKRVNSESDFIILDQNKGFLCIEVKGGVKYIRENDKYIVVTADGEKIVKDISAFEQAEKSMRYFKKCYEDTYNIEYKGVYGFMAAFPNYSMKETVKEKFYQVPDVTIDKNDLGDLLTCIRKAFLYWSRNNNFLSNLFVEQSRKNLVALLKRTYAIEASKGALIDYKNKELEKINDVQQNIIMLLQNYKTFAMKGAAGTGKSWIAYQMALKSAVLENRKTLLINKSKLLSEYFIKQHDLSGVDNLDVLPLNVLINKLGITDIEKYNIQEDKKYGVIIVDEAQDFNEAEAFFVKDLLINDISSQFYVFYDDEQNIFNNNLDTTLNKFMIDSKPFVLTENLRNTKNIYEWAKERTSLGEATFSNQIDGPDPTIKSFRTINQISKHLNIVINNLINNDEVPSWFINIVVDDDLYNELFNSEFDFEVKNELSKKDKKFIGIYSVSQYKGLESNVIFYIHRQNTNYNFKYIGLTRARFFLYDIEYNEI